MVCNGLCATCIFCRSPLSVVALSHEFTQVIAGMDFANERVEGRMRSVLLIIGVMLLTVPAVGLAQPLHLPEASMLAAKDDKDKPEKVIITGKGGKVKDVRKSPSDKDKKK